MKERYFKQMIIAIVSVAMLAGCSQAAPIDNSVVVGTQKRRTHFWGTFFLEMCINMGYI